MFKSLIKLGVSLFGEEIAESLSDGDVLDINGDGIADSVAIDTDEDGLVDSIAIDSDGDGLIDSMAMDTDGDGLIDSVAMDTDGDGMIDSVAMDTNSDGSIDNIALDTDNDGKLDTLVQSFCYISVSVFTVYNYTGKSVMDEKINSENTVVNLENLSQGIYVISIGDNIKQTLKIIKQ